VITEIDPETGNAKKVSIPPKLKVTRNQVNAQWQSVERPYSKKYYDAVCSGNFVADSEVNYESGN
jgi:hypothetical protein